MNHTPGPWSISKLATPDYAPEFAIYAGPGPKVALVTHGNSEANARMIAAAPDLLRELQKVHRVLRKQGYDMSSINEVIEGATGATP